MWRRLLWVAWACVTALAFAATAAPAASGVPANPHQGTSEFPAALNVCANALATVEAQSENTPSTTALTSDVPDAARATTTLSEWVKSGDAVVRHAQNLQRAGQTVTKAAAGDLVRAARQHGVKVRLDPPHPKTNWSVPHLNVGAKGRVHVPVAEGYFLPP